MKKLNIILFFYLFIIFNTTQQDFNLISYNDMLRMKHRKITFIKYKKLRKNNKLM